MYGLGFNFCVSMLQLLRESCTHTTLDAGPVWDSGLDVFNVAAPARTYTRVTLAAGRRFCSSAVGNEGTGDLID